MITFLMGIVVGVALVNIYFNIMFWYKTHKVRKVHNG